jgi:ESCRT-II complex subunit VPS36
MDLFYYCTDSLRDGEEVFMVQNGIRFYHGEERVQMTYECGTASLTSHRIKWKNPVMIISLDLKTVQRFEKSVPKSFSFSRQKTPKITLYLQRVEGMRGQSPFPSLGLNVIKLTFTSGGCEEFAKMLQQVLFEKRWDRPLVPSGGAKFRPGIVGIERQLEKQVWKTEQDISEAFRDINSLIEMAKPMVQLANTISNKMKDKQGNISDDETIQFRQHLLSLGVKDPVTKAKYGHGHVYFEKLALEMSNALSEQVREGGGMMSLVEAYCRLNRARGVELVSPEDLLNACHCLERMKLPIQLREFESKVKVLQHESFNDDVCVATAISLLDEHYSMTPQEYATLANIPLLLAKHSLILSEKRGKACRDESVEGVRFYQNLFFDEN